MKRYEMEVKMDGDPGLYGGPVCEPVESQDGEWVRYEDIKHLLGDVPLGDLSADQLLGRLTACATELARRANSSRSDK